MAYTSIVSLLRTMELLMTVDQKMQSLICDHREVIINLHKKVGSLEAFLKNSEKQTYDTEAMTFLLAQIKDVASAAEYKIEVGLTETIMAKDEVEKEEAHERVRESLQQVAQDIDCVQKESSKIRDKGSEASNKSSNLDSSSVRHTLDVQNNMVGRDTEKKKVLLELTRGSSDDLKVIPIIGMGGIGKTTLATQVFKDSSVQSHFDIHAWATISKEYNVKEILLSLLRSVKMEKNVNKMDEPELADLLQKSLKGRRYLIIMDDIWSREAWDDMQICFPDNKNGSRIILTTREIEIASYASSGNLSLQLDFMNSDESWNLFESTAFPNKGFPLELETIGKHIAHKCQGLPLTLLVVARLLSRSETKIAAWENVAENVKSFAAEDPDKQCLHVLALSYDHLPDHLKACLLYLAIFPEDTEISVKRLARLWTAEGFLKLERNLEGEAQKCIQNLIDRCLVIANQKSFDGRKIKTCKLHDLIHEFCLREAQSQNFFQMNDNILDELSRIPSECPRRISMRSMQHLRQFTGGGIDESGYVLMKQTRSIFSFGACNIKTLHVEFIHLKLLRILDLRSTLFTEFPPEILCLNWLRYLALSCRRHSNVSDHFNIPPGICKLLNLQTFIVQGEVSPIIVCPKSIWETMQLSRLELGRFYLPNPPHVSVDGGRYLFSSEASSISGLLPNCCRKEVILRIGNIKKLGIRGYDEDYKGCRMSKLFDNLVHLNQLEALSIRVDSGYIHWNYQVFTPSAKAFPVNLKKLKLVGTCLTWIQLNVIGELPNLEVLKLGKKSCNGPTWNPIEGGFAGLKHLLIDCSKLKQWIATNEHFPALEHLVIRNCSDLENIPVEFADIESLQLIELKNCKSELLASAVRIQEEQEYFGIKAVDVHSYNDESFSDGESDSWWSFHFSKAVDVHSYNDESFSDGESEYSLMIHQSCATCVPFVLKFQSTITLLVFPMADECEQVRAGPLADLQHLLFEDEVVLVRERRQYSQRITFDRLDDIVGCLVANIL